MPRFPVKESEIIALAQSIANGMQANPTVFPNPPVSITDLTSETTHCLEVRENVTAAEAALKQQHLNMDANIGGLADMMKDMIKYAELVAKGDAGILALINWGNPAAPTALQPPAQCRAMEIVNQGNGWVHVDWKEPAGGGKVAAYKVQRSEDGINFTDAFTAMVSEATLFNQPTGKNLIYRAVALNKAGEGMPSNTVSLVL